MQVPVEMPLTVTPLIEQTLGVMLENVTVRPDVAVADTDPVPPTLIDGAAPNIIV